jgi:hypothetical protein
MTAILIIKSARPAGNLEENLSKLASLPVTCLASSGALHVFLVPSPDSNVHIKLLEDIGRLGGGNAVETVWLYGGPAGWQLDGTTRQVIPWIA